MDPEGRKSLGSGCAHETNYQHAIGRITQAAKKTSLSVNPESKDNRIEYNWSKRNRERGMANDQQQLCNQI